MKHLLDDMDDEMLAKFLLDEVTEEERLRVKQWIARNPQNTRYFSHFELIWAKSRLLAQTTTVDENAAWQRFRDRVASTSQTAVVVPLKKSVNWLRIAAMITITIGVISLFYILLPRSAARVQVSSKETILIDTLPDKSIVTLNKNSALSYEEQSGSKRYRKAKLKGEGFFNISPDKSKPFIVEVDGISVQVVGTSFNIKSLRDSTEIIVETGVVTVTKNHQVFTLVKGDKLMVPRSGLIHAKQRTTDHLYNYYRSRQFVCDNTPLWKLVEVLNDAYQVNIVIENKKAAGELLTTTFDNETIDKILSILAETFNLSVVKKADRIILK